MPYNLAESPQNSSQNKRILGAVLSRMKKWQEFAIAVANSQRRIERRV